MSNRKKIGLALGSGGSKGLAHIGVIKILEKHGVPIDYIAGTSAGAIVGGFYALDKNIVKIERFALSMNKRKFMALNFKLYSLQGITIGEDLKVLIDKFTEKFYFEDLKIPFAAVATDLYSGKPVALNTGRLSTAIKASMSVPVVFGSMKVDEMLLIDGGVHYPVPVEIVRKMGADIILAIDLFGDYEGISKTQNFDLYEELNKANELMLRQIAAANTKNADIIITPYVGYAGLIDQFISNESIMKTIKLGETAMEEKIKELKKMI